MSTLARSWVTIDTAAEATGRSPRTIRRWITTGRLPYADIAGRRYVPELAALRTERDTRRAAHAGRPGRHGPKTPQVIAPCA